MAWDSPNVLAPPTCATTASAKPDLSWAWMDTLTYSQGIARRWDKGSPSSPAAPDLLPVHEAWSGRRWTSAR